MSQRPGRKISRHQAAPPSMVHEQQEKARRLKIIVGAAAMAFLVQVVIVVVVTGGSDDTPSAGEQVGFAETIGSALPVYDDTVADTALGAMAPEISAQNFAGESVKITPGDGTSKIIGFFVHWCPHCQAELPRIIAALDDNPVPEGTEVVMVSTGVDESRDNYPPSEWFDDEGWSGITVRDSEDSRVATGYGMGAFPYFVVVDGDGLVVARTSGELTDAGWEALVNAAA